MLGPSLDGLSTSADLISEVMELDFIENSDNVVVCPVRDAEVSMHQELVGVTSAILVTKQAPTLTTMGLAVQCTTVLT